MNNTGTEPERKLPREWVQISEVTQNISNGMSKVSEPNHTAAKRELGLFCNSLLEVHEDDLIAAIREGTQTGATFCSQPGNGAINSFGLSNLHGRWF